MIDAPWLRRTWTEAQPSSGFLGRVLRLLEAERTHQGALRIIHEGKFLPLGAPLFRARCPAPSKRSCVSVIFMGRRFLQQHLGNLWKRIGGFLATFGDREL